LVGLGHGPQRLNERFAQRSGEGTACPFRRLDQLRSSGHAAAPPSPAMNSRCKRQMLIWPSGASQWIKPETVGQQEIGDRGRTDPARRMGPALGQRRPLARSVRPGRDQAIPGSRRALELPAGLAETTPRPPGGFSNRRPGPVHGFSGDLASRSSIRLTNSWDRSTISWLSRIRSLRSACAQHGGRRLG
jgi:hypothetical protein